MRKNNFGELVLDEDELFNLIMKDVSIESLNNLVVDSTVDRSMLSRYVDSKIFESWKTPESNETAIEDFDQKNQSQWFMPDEYKNMDIEAYLVHVCPKQNYQRLIEELQEFKSRNMLNLLRWLKYFVDTCRKNNVIWGVGRGSSVSSYVLYLLGIHKIDSIKYKLDYREFLR